MECRCHRDLITMMDSPCPHTSRRVLLQHRSGLRSQDKPSSVVWRPMPRGMRRVRSYLTTGSRKVGIPPLRGGESPCGRSIPYANVSGAHHHRVSNHTLGSWSPHVAAKCIAIVPLLAIIGSNCSRALPILASGPRSSNDCGGGSSKSLSLYYIRGPRSKPFSSFITAG